MKKGDKLYQCDAETDEVIEYTVIDPNHYNEGATKPTWILKGPGGKICTSPYPTYKLTKEEAILDRINHIENVIKSNSDYILQIMSVNKELYDRHGALLLLLIKERTNG